MDLSDSAFHIHGLVVVIYTTDDLDSKFFPMNSS
jgi:hypothetical protein